MKKVLLLAITLLLVNGCAVQAPQPTRTGPGVLLMAQADELAANGEHSQAIALLERAVRIEPRNGHAWLRLARLHVASGDLNKAQQFARRAMQFAGTEKMLKRACQELLDNVSQQLKKPG